MTSALLRQWMDDGVRESVVDVARLKLTDDGVARWLGYGTLVDGAPDHVIDVVAGMLERARTLLEPRWAWRPVEAGLDFDRDTVVVRGGAAGELSVGRIVLSQIAASQAVAVFVISIGPRLEAESRRMFHDGNSLEGYVLDAIGSAAVEACADVLEADIDVAVAPMNWRITNRFSPGYCTWATADQHALFALLPGRPAGVTLGESALMTPIKSISGIIGLGERVKHRPYMCDVCTMEHCRQRLVAARPA